MNNVLYKNERATEHCAQMTLSNLVKVWSPPDVELILAHPTTSSTSQTRSQRCLSSLTVKINAEQGGCLYERPCSQSVLGKVSRETCARRIGRGKCYRPGESLGTLPKALWQKPGIGSTVYPLSPVRKWNLHGRGTPSTCFGIPSMERAVTMTGGNRIAKV